MTAITAVCTQGPRAAHGSELRRASDIKWCIIHSAEAADEIGPDHTAEAVANFFAQQSTQASTQLAADRDSCVRMLPDLVIPWAAPGANTNGLHIEICGRATWTRQEWMLPHHTPMLDRAAFKVAVWCFHYKIPARWVGPLGLRLGRKGLSTHNDVSQAFKKGSHWDPGPNFPKTFFLQLVQKHLNNLKHK